MRISNFYKQDLPLEPIVSLPRIFHTVVRFMMAKAIILQP